MPCVMLALRQEPCQCGRARGSPPRILGIGPTIGAPSDDEVGRDLITLGVLQVLLLFAHVILGLTHVFVAAMLL
jgi:hypothetical protein